MESKSNKLTVCQNEYFEISMLSNSGSTGYSWCVSELSGSILLCGDENQMTSNVPGASHKKIFKFIAKEGKAAKIVFQLVRPWLPDEPIVQNEYEIVIEESHSHDELKKFVDENSFPKRALLKYGFIINKPAMPYGVLNTESNQISNGLGIVQVDENDVRCVLKYGFPYASNGVEECMVKYGFMAETSKIK